MLNRATLPSGFSAPTLTSGTASAATGSVPSVNVVKPAGAAVGCWRCCRPEATTRMPDPAERFDRASAAPRRRLPGRSGLVVVAERETEHVDQVGEPRLAGLSGRDLALVEEAEGVDQVGLLDDPVGAHHLDRQDVRVRADLADQPGDEGAVAEERVDQALQRIDQVGIRLATGRPAWRARHCRRSLVAQPGRPEPSSGPSNQGCSATPVSRIATTGRRAALSGRRPGEPADRRPATQPGDRVLAGAGAVPDAEAVADAEADRRVPDAEADPADPAANIRWFSPISMEPRPSRSCWTTSQASGGGPRIGVRSTRTASRTTAGEWVRATAPSLLQVGPIGAPGAPSPGRTRLLSSNSLSYAPPRPGGADCSAAGTRIWSAT